MRNQKGMQLHVNTDEMHTNAWNAMACPQVLAKYFGILRMVLSKVLLMLLLMVLLMVAGFRHGVHLPLRLARRSIRFHECKKQLLLLLTHAFKTIPTSLSPININNNSE